MLPLMVPSAPAYAGVSSHLTELYIPRDFIVHAASLRHPFGHCAKFPTAASRRSLDRISVPVWGYRLSAPLLIIALVGRYPANKLINRELLLQRFLLLRIFHCSRCREKLHAGLSPVSRDYSSLKDRLFTCYSPVCH